MKALVLPDLAEQPPILETQVHNWHIENWRDHPRRDHGPIFHAGGHPWYAKFSTEEKLGRYPLLTSVGAFFSSLMATMSIMSPSISNTPIRKETLQMILLAAYNSGWLHGTQRRQVSTNSTLLTTGLQRRRATGALHDLWSYASYTRLRGMIPAGTCWERIILPILRHM